MQAIVLVGGEGTRLRPLTSDVPKPAVTLVDRPFLAYAIEWLAGHGVTEVVLACGFLPDVLREALSDEEARAGVEITYVAEPEPLGTAGAIRFAADALGERLEERFLALNGDVLADLDLSALLRAHEERGARATIGLHPVDDSSAYGLVRCDDEGKVLEFLEKTGEEVPGEINAGAYVLDRSVLDLVPAGQAVSIER
jgi:mannose-1-phosphate guanylyltransferase